MSSYGLLQRRQIFLFGVVLSVTKASATVDAKVDQWLSEASKIRSRKLYGVLSITRFRDAMYVLNQPISWQPSINITLPAITVPRGFVTDLASIPRPFFSMFRPDGDYAHAAVIHDYLYWTQKTSKETADQIFAVAMSELGISSFDRKILFEAVSNLGSTSWNHNAEAKKAGEKRILKKFPTDPTTTWENWKKLQVFLD